MSDKKRDFEADRKICNAAPKGPWEYGGFGQGIYRWVGPQAGPQGPQFLAEAGSGTDGEKTDNIGKFIAEARQGWPAALDRIEELQGELDVATMAIADLQDEAKGYVLGRQAAFAVVLATIRQYRGKEIEEDTKAAKFLLNESSYEMDTRTGRIQAAHVLLDEILALAGLQSGESPPLLPPDKIRKQRDIYRRALEKLAVTRSHGFDLEASTAEKALKQGDEVG